MDTVFTRLCRNGNPKLFEITIFGKKRDLTYLVGALVIAISMGCVVWAVLTMPIN